MVLSTSTTLSRERARRAEELYRQVPGRYSSRLPDTGRGGALAFVLRTRERGECRTGSDDREKSG